MASIPQRNLRYQCDLIINIPQMTRCPNAAVMAFDQNSEDGLEMLFFCHEHMPSSWEGFITNYVIRNDELVETGISKQRQTGEVSELRDLAKSALERHAQVKADREWLKELGVKW